MKTLPKILSDQEMTQLTQKFWDQSQQIIYIDVKVHTPEDLNSWSPGRRQSFLINEDAPPPYSVDENVWSSMLTEQDLAHLENLHAPLQFEIQNNFLISFFGLKPLTFAEVITYLHHHPLDRKIVGFSPNPQLAERFFTQFPSLGFDVADSWRLSGICNCGYDPDEKIALREQFGGALNSHHLFETECDARKFAQSCDVRVPEHAPFRVFQIFDLRS